MVDMRGEGEVDANGWQYGRTFTTTTWRPSVKSFSRSGWVRRRRWVRLMMKPAQAFEKSETEPPIPNNPALSAAGDVWKDDDNDWDRCRRAIKAQPTDGQKLELWSAWLRDSQVGAISQKHLATNLEAILQQFIYPETRAQLLLLRDSSLVPGDLVELPSTDFWSYREMLKS